MLHRRVFGGKKIDFFEQIFEFQQGADAFPGNAHQLQHEGIGAGHLVQPKGGAPFQEQVVGGDDDRLFQPGQVATLAALFLLVV